MKGKHTGKIFIIGLPKTATKTVSIELSHLGYSCFHFPTEAEHFENDVLGDIPIVLSYRRFDQLYPKSFFIWTTRDTQSWHESCKFHFSEEHKIKNEKSLVYRMALFNSLFYDYEAFENARQKHARDITEYFRGRDDLLTINVVGGDPKSLLYDFLGIEYDFDKQEGFQNFDPTEYRNTLKGIREGS